VVIVCRTLEYLLKHLARVAEQSDKTGMTTRNMAIVWAPNLIRCKDLEAGGVIALKVTFFKFTNRKEYSFTNRNNHFVKGIGVQAIVTEYLVRTLLYLTQ
jgi:hypothetical protein